MCISLSFAIIFARNLFGGRRLSIMREWGVHPLHSQVHKRLWFEMQFAIEHVNRNLTSSIGITMITSQKY